MARSVTVLDVFLASPCDVDQERGVVANAIAQWNVIRGRDRGIIFNLIRWETGVSAGIGNYGQDVVNDQTPDSFDLFIALFWSRLGSPTDKAESGTVEEFNRALRLHTSGRAVQIALYFKQTPISPMAIDTTQFASLARFREGVHRDGAFTKNFISDDALRFEIDLLLDRTARDLSIVTSPDQGTSKENTVELTIAEGESRDVGLIDTSEQLELHSVAATAFLNGMTDRLGAITAETESITQVYQEIGRYRQVQSCDVKELIFNMSASFDLMSDYIEQDGPGFAENSLAMAQDILDLIDLSADFDNRSQSLRQFEVLVEGLIDGMARSIEQNEGFLVSLKSLQRMSTAFNKSRRRLVTNYEKFISEIGNIRSITGEALNELKRLTTKMEFLD